MRRTAPTTAPSCSTPRCPAAWSATCTAACGTGASRRWGAASVGRGSAASGRSSRSALVVLAAAVLPVGLRGLGRLVAGGRRRRGRWSRSVGAAAQVPAPAGVLRLVGRALGARGRRPPAGLPGGRADRRGHRAARPSCVPLALLVLVGVGDPAERRRLGAARGRRRLGVRRRRARRGAGLDGGGRLRRDVAGRDAARAAGARWTPAAGGRVGRVEPRRCAMAERPYILLSCGMSLDGYLDDATDERLLLSNDADFDRVDEVRAGCDAILVGAATVRNDNPRLLVRTPSAASRAPAARAAGPADEGHGDRPAPSWTRRRGSSPPATARSSSTAPRHRGEAARAAGHGRHRGRRRPPGRAARGSARTSTTRGVRRLMVEGGGTVHTQFLTDGLADELQLVVAPFFVGDSGRAGSSATAGSRGAPTAGPSWSRPGRSATSCCCATRCPTASSRAIE